MGRPGVFLFAYLAAVFVVGLALVLDAALRRR